jgi:asparagine synthase (glutamine-hydrolysing)
MAGIAGIARNGAVKEVGMMLEAINYRGRSGRHIIDKDGITAGVIWNEHEDARIRESLQNGEIGYSNGPGHYVRAIITNGQIRIYRDELGVAPLYYGKDKSGSLSFASEVKSLLKVTDNINELPPGYSVDTSGASMFYKLKKGKYFEQDPEKIAKGLLKIITEAVMECISSEEAGSWLSGGLDSSSICALAARKVKKLKTFTAGIKDAPDIKYAREMAQFIRSEHHEIVVTVDDLIKVLPEVIYHLESFDALLVRSSLTNYLVAKLSSEHTNEVFSGEGGDELFAGYDYLKSIPLSSLEDELVKITGNLHNTALQRVDRCASANGITAHVIFANPDVVKFAFMIPVRYKILENTEKWILRRALDGLLPEEILNRPKAKFWEGAGIKDLISDYASGHITDRDFMKERTLSNGLILNTKEELFYYRLFSDHFGNHTDLSWMGRTKGSPVEL